MKTKLYMVIGVVLMAFIIPGVTYFTGFMSEYSVGDRSGIITKFSYKGRLIDSYEGEMIQGGMKTIQGDDGSTSSAANVFEFSVLDEDVAQKVKRAYDSGKRVGIHYTQ